jgi:hypothetical protein
MAFMPQMSRLQHALDHQGVPALAPSDPDRSIDFIQGNKHLEYKRSLSLSHMRKVQNPLTYAILVANFDKQGVDGYIGPNTFAEIAVAFASNKTIYLLNVAPRQYACELAAWRVRALDGDLTKVIAEYEELCRHDPAQPRLLRF